MLSYINKIRVGGSEDPGCGSVVEHLPQMHKALGTIPKGSKCTKCPRKTALAVVFIVLSAEGLKGLGFKDLAEGNIFPQG